MKTPNDIANIDDHTDDASAPQCPDCLALGDIEIDENARLRVELLTRYDQVIEHLRDARQTNVTHAISLEGLKFHYRVERAIACGLPDRMGHKEGLIVTTACGLTLNIGHMCGARWIAGLDKLVEIQKRTNAYDGNLRTIADEPAKIRARVEQLLSAASKLDDARIGLADYARPLARFMRETTSDPRGREVLIERRQRDADGNVTIHNDNYILQGRELWTQRPDAKPLLRRLKLLDEEVAAARAADPALNEQHAALARRIRAVKGAVRPLQRWIDDASSFFSHANLAAALVGARHGAASVSHPTAPPAIVIKDDGVRRTISADGVVEEGILAR
jgi:hypothetical protein